MTRSGCPRRAAVAWVRRHVRRSERYAVGNGKLTNALAPPQRPRCAPKIADARPRPRNSWIPFGPTAPKGPGRAPSAIFGAQGDGRLRHARNAVKPEGDSAVTAPAFRDPLLAALAPRLAAVEARTRAVVAGLAPGLLAAKPPGGGWSVAEVFEHLARGNEAYLVAMAKAVGVARRRGAGGGHRPSLFGGLLLRAIAEENPTKLPTVPKMRPVVVRDRVVEGFLATLERTLELAREADGADLRTRLWSPIAPVPLNLGEAFAILATHAERHLGQAERVRRALGA
jgi:hypothetical protein